MSAFPAVARALARMEHAAVNLDFSDSGNVLDLVPWLDLFMQQCPRLRSIRLSDVPPDQLPNLQAHVDRVREIVAASAALRTVDGGEPAPPQKLRVLNCLGWEAITFRARFPSGE